MNKKILLFISFTAIAVVISIINFNSFARNYFIKSNQILYTLNLIDNEENNLNYEILAGSLFLYQDNDLIVSKVYKIDKLVKELVNNQFLRQRHPLVYKELLKYNKAFKNKENLIFEYLRYALPLKNALTYLGYSLNDINLSIQSSKYVIRYMSGIFLAKSSIDSSFLNNIDLKKLKGINKSFILNLNVFLRYFPKYQKFLNSVLNSQTDKILHQALNKYMKDIKKDIKIFEILSILMIVFIATVFLGIILLLIKLEKSFQKIKYLATHDSLTNLPNINKFKKDTKNENGIFAIINIDRFKNINDYFGFDVGDKLLKFISIELKKFATTLNANIYRIGADDFGLFVNVFDIDVLKEEIQNFIDKIENITFDITNKNLNINITLSAGITDTKPYLETADLAMKSVKKDFKDKIGIFDHELNKQIEINIKKSNEITYAIKKNKIKTVFQPIMNKDKNIVKYEVLSRVLHNDKLLSIYPYLEVLKENKLYTKLTDIVLRNSLKVLEDYQNVNLSINLAMEDILDEEISKYIIKNCVEFSDRITFEILESEIGDYKKFESFIKHFNGHGFSFAIDDFGSGYSNFERLMRLNIDYLKIDGSLIKNLDTDFSSNVIVETIIDFAKKTDIKTVAEYIHNENVFSKCIEKGIDLFQGFYLAEPKKYFKI